MNSPESALSRVRDFCFNNRSFVDFIFLSLYSLEQIGLVLAVYLLKDSASLEAAVSIFSILVLATAAMQKIILESIMKQMESNLRNIQYKFNHAIKKLKQFTKFKY